MNSRVSGDIKKLKSNLPCTNNLGKGNLGIMPALPGSSGPVESHKNSNPTLIH